MQNVDSCDEAYAPAAQAAHVIDPWPIVYQPGVHGKQLKIDDVGWYFPALHSEQLDDPEGEVPGGQLEAHALAPAVLKPEAQFRHEEDPLWG